MDICQSVLASCFVRATSGAFDLDNPEQLMKLLVTMARNKLASQARKQYAQRRDKRRGQRSGKWCRCRSLAALCDPAFQQQDVAQRLPTSGPT
jgi:hypothetical protein